MKIGAMTDPQRDVLEEIRQIAAEGFDYVELVIEAPRAEPEMIDVAEVRRILDGEGIGVICQAPSYLPVDNPSLLVRRAAMEELIRCLDVAAGLGSKLLTTHYRHFPAFWPDGMGQELYVQLFGRLCQEAAQRNVVIAMENHPDNTHQLKHFREIFARTPNLYLLLDVGHANIDVVKNLTPEYLFSLADRLLHVHVSDNDGVSDLHLPLGAPGRGGVGWRRIVSSLKSFSFDGTVTVEVLTPDRRYRQESRNRWLSWWEGA